MDLRYSTFHVGRVLTSIEEESKPLSLPDQASSSSSEQASSIVSRKRSAEDSVSTKKKKIAMLILTKFALVARS